MVDVHLHKLVVDFTQYLQEGWFRSIVFDASYNISSRLHILLIFVSRLGAEDEVELLLLGQLARVRLRDSAMDDGGGSLHFLADVLLVLSCVELVGVVDEERVAHEQPGDAEQFLAL